jgi:hypothetical protein
MPLDYPLWLRATHFFNFLFLSPLVRSGLEILSAHPRLYWKLAADLEPPRALRNVHSASLPAASSKQLFASG